MSHVVPLPSSWKGYTTGVSGSAIIRSLQAHDRIIRRLEVHDRYRQVHRIYPQTGGTRPAILILIFKGPEFAGLQLGMLRCRPFPRKQRRRVSDERLGI